MDESDNCGHQDIRLYKNGDVIDMNLIPGSGRSPGGEHGQPTPVFLPGESHGQRSLAGCSP